MKYIARANVEFEIELPKGYKFLIDFSKEDVKQQLSYNISNHIHLSAHRNGFREVTIEPKNIKVKNAHVLKIDREYSACPWCTMPNGEHEFECPYGGNGVK